TRNDFELARQIVDDSIDVLVDLTGWTSEQRMQSFIMRPAPVLVTYLGYPNTTGLEEIDYRITDRRADPPGADALYAEKLFRLPRCAWGFGLTEKTPSIKDRSADAPIVFGSFNNLRKTTATTLDLWARVLARVPESRLLLKSKQLKHARAKARVMDELSSRGVDPSRVELRSMTLHRYDHLDAYGEMDIALDTFPYNGTTTTCEALYMGVPVVSLQGETPASRVGASLLQAVGLPDLSTTDGDAYVETAVRLSRDRQRVSELRATLRERLRASELGDQRGMARALEDAYRQMWSAWVGSQHP
ncbi:MAG: hypothetical protein HOV80_03760, partial [Polyangiaceae bacterium]|nr:hypothetical protein [Polyangiaceae bacterium]